MNAPPHTGQAYQWAQYSGLRDSIQVHRDQLQRDLTTDGTRQRHSLTWLSLIT